MIGFGLTLTLLPTLINGAPLASADSPASPATAPLPIKRSPETPISSSKGEQQVHAEKRGYDGFVPPAPVPWFGGNGFYRAPFYPRYRTPIYAAPVMPSFGRSFYKRSEELAAGNDNESKLAKRDTSSTSEQKVHAEKRDYDGFAPPAWQPAPFYQPFTYARPWARPVFAAPRPVVSFANSYYKRSEEGSASAKTSPVSRLAKRDLKDNEARGVKMSKRDWDDRLRWGAYPRSMPYMPNLYAQSSYFNPAVNFPPGYPIGMSG
jgi:hypothetical protein